MVGACTLFTIWTLVLPEQPNALVTVTEYVPGVVTVMAWVMAPVLHWYTEPVLAVMVVEPHRETTPPGVMVGVGVGWIVTGTGDEMPEQPPGFVTWTV